MVVHSRWRVTVVAVLFSLHLGSGFANGACNFIPDAKTITQQPQPLVAAPYQGMLGSIGTTVIDPNRPGSFIVQPSASCLPTNRKQVAALDAPTPPRLDRDTFVSFVVESADRESADVVLLGSKKLCRLVSSSKTAKQSESDVRIASCDWQGLEVGEEDNEPLFRVDYASLKNLANNIAETSEDAGQAPRTVTVLAGRNPDNGADLRDLVQKVRSQGCTALCPSLLRNGGLVCIDMFLAKLASGSYTSDDVLCRPVVQPSAVPDNDFGAQCDETSGTVTDLKDCGDAPMSLEFWQDICGGVHMTFNWEKIRRTANGDDFDSKNPAADCQSNPSLATCGPLSRELFGRSGAARRKKAGTDRVWVPGREFLGSTLKGDLSGTTNAVDWRFPDIDVWFPNSKTFGLRGTVDQDTSTIHMYPRMPVGVFCRAQGSTKKEGCMAVEGRYKGNGIECACRDRYAADCNCLDQVDPGDRRFFACSDQVAPGLWGQPCTRHAHCNPTGKCTEKPRCVEKGEVWWAGRPWPKHQGSEIPCWHDTKCENNADANSHNLRQCGWRLFNLEDRDGRLDSELDMSASPVRVRRGVCKKTAKACTNKPAGKVTCDLATEGKCRGYRFIAGERR